MSEVSKDKTKSSYFTAGLNHTIINGYEKNENKNTLTREQLISKFSQQLYNYYPDLNHKQLVDDYFKNFIACFLLEFNEQYNNTEIVIPSRYKAHYSALNKMIYRATKGKDELLKDIFGMTIVINSTKDRLASNSPLSKQRDENIKILNELNDFKDSQLIRHDQNKPLTKTKYFNNLITLLESLQNLCSPEATELKEHFKLYEKIARDRLNYLPIIENPYVEPSDLNIFKDGKNNKTDFELLLNTYSEMIDDEINFQILMRETEDVFNNSKRLAKFGFEIMTKDIKRNPNGFVAKFLKVDTLAGPIEIQFKTAYQFEQGLTGYTAHSVYKDNPVPPPFPDLNDPESLESYRRKIKFMTPEMYTSSVDNQALNPAVIITKKNQYYSLKNTLQHPTNDPRFEITNKYLTQAYKNRREYFADNYNDESDSYMYEDIDEYLESGSIEKLAELKKSKEPMSPISIDSSSRNIEER